MRFLQASCGKLRVDGRGALVVASMMALSGCATATHDANTLTAVTPAQATNETAAATPAAAANGKPTRIGAYRDPALVSAANPYGIAVPAQHATASAAPADIGGMAMQPTGINAGRSSIFSTQAQPMAANSDSQGAPAYVQTPGVNAAFSSVYSTTPQAIQPEPVATPVSLPLSKAKDSAENRAFPNAAPKTEAEKAVTFMPGTAAAVLQGQKAAAAGLKTPETISAAAEPPPASDTGLSPETKPSTLAAFWAAGSKKNPSGQRSSDETVGTATPAAKPVETASLALGALGTVKPPVTSMSDEFDDETDEGPTGLMKLVSLPSLNGLTRLAPNGLLVQTEHVNTDCFQPNLVNKIKSIEGHYGKPAIVTSGFRETQENRLAGGARGSMHTSCQAADIQVEGVSKNDLAGYLRSLPDRGGVGTYCHTESVHIDTGEARDWNWRCRRMARKG